MATRGSRRVMGEGTIASVGDRRAPIHPAHDLGETSLARSGFVSDEERVALARTPVFPRSLAAGEGLVRQGSSPDHLYFLTSGWAYRYVTTRDGGQQIATLLVPGGVCNLDNLLFERADFGVRMLTAATVLALPRTHTLALAAEHPGVGRAFTWLALAENAILTQWAVGLGRRSAQERLAHLLCELSVRMGTDDAGGSSFDLPLTQEVIADVLGLTPVHVNRTMRHLRTEGLIAMAGRSVTILDVERLRALADFNASYLRQIERSGAVSPVGTI